MTELGRLWKDAKIGDLDNIAEVALSEIKGLDVNELYEYALDNREALNIFYRTKRIDDVKIDDALKYVIVRRGWDDYDSLLFPKGCIGIFKARADRLFEPEFLAYCINNNVFSKRELGYIPLRKGDTIEAFVKKYEQKDLLANLRKDLLNPRIEMQTVSEAYYHNFELLAGLLR